MTAIRTVAMRADSSPLIGVGHVMRCLTLADELRRRGARVTFVSKEPPGEAVDQILRHGHSIRPIARPAGCEKFDWSVDARLSKAALQEEAPVDWLVVDHYELDAAWEVEMASVARATLVIDDLANREHHCAVLLDQNFYGDGDVLSPYRGLLPSGCVELVGPLFSLLRPEFAQWRANGRRRDGTVQRIHVSFGGSDPTNETLKAVAAIARIEDPGISTDIVIGALNRRSDEIAAAASGLENIAWHFQPPNMAELMMHADLAIGGAGTSTWERCCLGLPAIAISVAANQERIATSLASAGALFYVGRSPAVTSQRITTELRSLLAEPGRLAAAASRGMELVDGKGVKRVADTIWST